MVRLHSQLSYLICDNVFSNRLNEGFATLYENYLASLVYPDDRLMDLFVVNTMQTVLDVDASATIRPMTHYVESPERISELFDRVAYDKGKY